MVKCDGCHGDSPGERPRAKSGKANGQKAVVDVFAMDTGDGVVVVIDH
ncbi:hypothetical protein SBADM41S_12050 [Streptomyces badius]